MKKTTLFSFFIIAVAIPATLFFGRHLPGRAYYLTSTLIIIETMLPFFFAFENRKPKARELVTIAVMCALATASRIVIPIPHFKPITAIIMIAGISLGAEAGFLIGAVSAFASNFFFSQGPWTPWQMMAYGTGGFIAGLLFRRWYYAPGKAVKSALIPAIFAFFMVVCVVGPLLDCCTLFTTSTTITGKFALAVFAAGFPNNLIHGAASAVTIILLSKPLLAKLDRIKSKYGMLEFQ